jgi:hypothetical protein
MIWNSCIRISHMVQSCSYSKIVAAFIYNQNHYSELVDDFTCLINHHTEEKYK